MRDVSIAMFCPNCAAANDGSQHYCRTCGLKLDAIAAELLDQRPSTEYAELVRRKNRFDRLGMASLSIAGLIGLCLLLGKAFYYKLVLFGPEVLFYSAFAALIVFGLASVFFFNYSNMFMKLDKVNPRLPAPTPDGAPVPVTSRLIEDHPFEPASVTEHSTELLRSPRPKK